jgi:prophage regulatory protein
MAARKVLRRKDILDVTGWPTSTLYYKIQRGVFPKGVKLDGNGKVVVWFEDEIEAWQKAALEAARSIAA